LPAFRRFCVTYAFIDPAAYDIVTGYCRFR
jgi:hypothetical protein